MAKSRAFISAICRSGGESRAVLLVAMSVSLIQAYIHVKIAPELAACCSTNTSPREGRTMKEEESSDDADSVSVYGYGLNHTHQ
jgi:hypothetical protein